jgi:putative Mg2+ transporter-C (MgtC) family protein
MITMTDIIPQAVTASMALFALPFDFSWFTQSVVSNAAVYRLLLACLLGGVIGIEREALRRAAGVRTNLLICMGCAFFTLLSAVLAGDGITDKGRVASNIVQGIGFLGAGLIMHNRSRVSGLASAASVFVVASIGMACGAGLYVPAIIATLIAMLAIAVVGFLERRVNLKVYPVLYESRGTDETKMLTSILDAMDKERERLSNVDRDTIGTLQRISFTLTATKRQHERLHARLIGEPAIDDLKTFHDPDGE